MAVGAMISGNYREFCALALCYAVVQIALIFIGDQEESEEIEEEESPVTEEYFLDPSPEGYRPADPHEPFQKGDIFLVGHRRYHVQNQNQGTLEFPDTTVIAVFDGDRSKAFEVPTRIIRSAIDSGDILHFSLK